MSYSQMLSLELRMASSKRSLARRTCSSSCFSISISVDVPNHLETLPALSLTGTARLVNQRYWPS